jgi:hypothetical protein
MRVGIDACLGRWKHIMRCNNENNMVSFYFYFTMPWCTIQLYALGCHVVEHQDGMITCTTNLCLEWSNANLSFFLIVNDESFFL